MVNHSTNATKGHLNPIGEYYGFGSQNLMIRVVHNRLWFLYPQLYYWCQSVYRYHYIWNLSGDV